MQVSPPPPQAATAPTTRGYCQRCGQELGVNEKMRGLTVHEQCPTVATTAAREVAAVQMGAAPPATPIVAPQVTGGRRAMFCQNCGSELAQHGGFCPGCGAGVGPARPQLGWQIAVSIICSVIALALLPPLFGAIGAIIGVYVLLKGEKTVGTMLIVAGIAAAMVGMTLSYAVWSSLR